MRRLSSRDISDARKVLALFDRCNIPAHSGQTAFYMMLSFFPFLMFIFSLLNFTPLSAKDFQDWMFTFIPTTFEPAIREFTEEIYNGSSGRISITVIIAIWLSSKAFVALQQGMNAMYRTKENRNSILLRVYALIYSLVFALLLIAVLGVMVFGNRIHDAFLADLAVFERIIHFRLIICIPILVLFFWLMYSFVPNKRQKLKNQIPGAIFSAVIWIIFSYGFSIYVDKYNNYASFYGTMTTIALIMVWLYGCMYMLFLGGFINYILEEKKTYKRRV